MSPANPRIVIIGAGPGGICMGIRLKAAGFDDFTIFDAAPDVGGVWHHNRYPGAACDTKATMYSYSFAQDGPWERQFAQQAEMRRYLERLVDRFGLRDHLKLRTPVNRAAWDEQAAEWEVWPENDDPVRADVVVSAVGMLNDPQLPDIPGRESFAGQAFHSARWPDDARSDGSVAVIGSGASAVQIVPELAGRAERLHVFQRSPGWILPKADGERDPERAAWRREVRRKLTFLRNPVTLRFSSLMKGTSKLRQVALDMLDDQVEDPQVRAALTPDYPFGCKRLLFSNTYLRAFNRPDVQLVTTGIRSIERDGVRTADGRLHEIDTIVYATGFKAAEYLSTLEVKGRDGQTLREAWSDGAYAHLGVSVPGFPNLFMLYGPNTNQGSIIFMIEQQVEHVVRAVRWLARRRGRTLEAQDRRTAAYNHRLDRRFRDSVWRSCSNYYTTADGRIPTQYPWSPVRYWLATRLAGPWSYRRGS